METTMNTRWAKLPEPHRSLIADGIGIVRIMHPNKTEEEYHRAEGKLATWVKSSKRGDKRIWTLTIGQVKLQRTEVL
jgi:hypothetical protein